MRPFVFESVRSSDRFVAGTVCLTVLQIVAKSSWLSASLRDAVEVMRRGIVIVLRQAVGVGKVRAGAAELLRARVHALHERRDAAADILQATTLHASFAEEIMAQ